MSPPDRPKRPIDGEPFRLVKRTEATIGEVAGQVSALSSQVTDVQARQNKMVLMVDGLVRTVNERADVLHEEIALLRATVTADHAPRIAAVEKTAGQKVGGAALWAGKYGSLLYVVNAAVQAGLHKAAEAWPQYADTLEWVRGMLPL
jgi:hypothetical protein